MKKKGWVEVTAWVKDTQRKAFREKYNGCLSRLVRNCIVRALDEREFFQEVFFYDGGEKE